MGFIYAYLKVRNNLSSWSITVRQDNSFFLRIIEASVSILLTILLVDDELFKYYNGEVQFNNFWLKDHTYLEVLKLPYDSTAPQTGNPHRKGLLCSFNKEC